MLAGSKSMHCYQVPFLCIILFLLVPMSAHAHEKNLPSPVSDYDFYDNGHPDKAKVALGKALFFDKILSGNRNIACATCHHGLTDTGDGLSLPIGEGARGLGVTRDTGSGSDAVIERVPRNAPPIFALGAKSMTVLFHDGRVEIDDTQTSGFRTPAGDNLPHHLENVLAAQAMFPVTSPTEMAGQLGENSIADAAANDNLAGPGGVWQQIADRLRNNPEYVMLFNQAFGINQYEITYAHAANAISAFESSAWRADNSPFDRHLRGDKKALSKAARKGMKLFYGKAGCSSCHSGKFQTDMQFHAIAMPQVGPGKGHGISGYEDFGREAVTGYESQRYHFRTPPLRNVVLTGPWGHSGAFDTLEGVVQHHLDPITSLMNYNCATEPRLPSRDDLNRHDCYVMNSPDLVAAIGEANELGKTRLSRKKIGHLMAFLHSLTDPDSLDLRQDIPRSVPSGLPLAD
ncbi:Methylamine utilization protein mauG precursor [hydrothermal vent metagenome]|uniref:Methylamine utilization protein mauG n=1 Tax=hydrothermal vent metagenome TaxID=652676 RepID=A0A3B0ZE13_9ZZZZ